MCGIAAIFAYKPAARRICQDELIRLKTSMRKRGPDGEGEWINNNQTVGLAHTRLAVIDISESGAQPMHSIDGKTVISFNGEIYNFSEQRRVLIKKGYHFKSNSDTEVLLNLYREYGKQMLTRLRGMFAFAIWDDESSSLFCARDHYGIKPLYYSDDGSTLRVASQVKTLLEADIESKEKDPAGQVGFYLFGHIPEPFTLYKSIRSLPAGCALTLNQGNSPTIERYSKISEIYHGASFQHSDKDVDWDFIEQSLMDSVENHLISDVPVGLFLSSGIDSGLILTLLARAGYKQISSITVSFNEYTDLDEDEAPMAARIATTCGARHDTVMIEESEIRTELTTFIDAMDQPSIDGLNTWLISRAASQCGLKVALSGLGGDELFGGYPSFYDIPRWRSYFNLGNKIPGLNVLLHRTLGSFRRMGLQVNPKVVALPGLAGSWPGAYLVRRGLFMPWELDEILGSELAQAGLEGLNPLQLIESEIEPDPGNGFARTAALESSLYMKNQLLRDTDWASMDHSLEVRTPLVDHVLLSDLAPALKFSNGEITKSAVAQKIGKNLPADWALRRKTGFTVPIHNWLSSIRDLDRWRRVPLLRAGNCHWARRWAYTVMSMASHAIT